MKKLKETLGAKLLGYGILAMVMFAVLFDPTEMALGSKYVELSAGWLSFAEVVGNFTWVFGIIYMLVILGAGAAIFSEEALQKAIKEAQDEKTFKAFRARWYKSIMSYVSMGLSLVAIGSGFWFVGITWLVAILMLKGMMARIRNTDEYKAWLEVAKAS